MATAGVPLWSTTAASNATADPAVNFAEGMAPSAVNDSARALMASVAKWRDDLYGITSGLTTGGTSTAYTVTTNSTYASAAVMSGAIFTIIPDATSGASPTLAVDGLTARALNVSTGVAVPTGALISGTPYMVRYVHSSTEFIVLNPSIKPNTALDIIGGTSLTTIAADDTLPIYDLSATANKRILVSDVLKVINALTADSSPDAAADYVMTYDASASAAKKVLLSNLPAVLPRGYIDGCTLSNGTDATNDINIAAGVCRDITNAVDISVPAITGKQLDANWAAGGSAGMRYSGLGIANTTYGVFATRTAASATADIYTYPLTAGTDADTTAFHATVLAALQAESGGSSYAYIRRIGAILRESAAIVPFWQDGDYFERKTIISSVNGVTGPGTSAVSRTLDVPDGVEVEANLVVGVSSTSNATYTLLSALNSTDEAPSVSRSQLFTINGIGNVTTAPVRVRTNTSRQVRSRHSASDANTILYISVRGLWDRRGKDA